MSKSKLDEILQITANRLEWIFPKILGAPYVDREKQATEIAEAKIEIKSLFLEVVSNSKKTFNKGGSGEFTQLDEAELEKRIKEL